MKTFLFIMLPILLMMIPLSFASGWQLIVTTDKQVYHVGDAVHIYGNITRDNWWPWGNGTKSVAITITGPQDRIATALIDGDGGFSYRIAIVQDIGTYNVMVNCEVAKEVVTNSTTFTVIPIVLTAPVIPYGPITTFAVLLMTAVAFQALKRRRATAL